MFLLLFFALALHYPVPAAGEWRGRLQRRARGATFR